MNYLANGTAVKEALARLTPPAPDPETLPEAMRATARDWLEDPCWDLHAGYPPGSAEEQAAKHFEETVARETAHRRLTDWLEGLEDVGLLALMDTLVRLGSSVARLQDDIIKLEEPLA